MPVSPGSETRRRLSCPRTAGYSHRTALAAPVVEAKEKLVNDRHPSGTMTTPASASEAASAPYASYGTQEAAYDGFTSYDTGYDTGAHPTTGLGDAAYATGTYDTGGYGTGTYDTGAYDSGQWSTSSHQTLNHDPYAAQHHAAYDTGAYDTTSWSAGYQQLVPQQQGAPDTSGQWDASTWLQADQPAGSADRTQQWEWGTQSFDTGAYDATQWNTADGEPTPGPGPYQDTGDPYQDDAEPYQDNAEPAATGELPVVETLPHAEDEDGQAPGELLLDAQEDVTPVPAPRAASRGGSRSRRRTPAKRSALLTVAVPSVCVMGVAGIAAASVGTLTGDDTDTSATAADAPVVKASAANDKLAAQLLDVREGADDFSDRVSREQERIDLKAQQELERKKALAEAARKERLRPKYAVPVGQHGLSAYYGQSGVNWMSMHTGIDFPVSYGTTVMAATDGVVRTQWNSAYGNMMIVTAKDGTETWYCHLSSYRVASGTTVKAGDPIAYSGNSGNSTGPHLHFEVRPSGGSHIDPLAWLRSHGLDPT
ncbi:peptidoglycan DD-metalloendopeptidase family protein [Streptomyces sp. bgisy159]|uniref:M23 family metallopeptidase n=1 Tax=Streptomyces sp. bgisy159 TaxID=3413795 RepID=UPI003F4A1CB3